MVTQSVTYAEKGTGRYLGSFLGEHVPPDNADAVPTAPDDARQLWDGHVWGQIQPTASDYRDAVQVHLDKLAQGYGYDSIASAVTYAEEPSVPKFQAEGIAFRALRSLSWAYCYAQLDAVTAGARAQPSVAELIAELPPLML